jgi:hypothetical protein
LEEEKCPDMCSLSVGFIFPVYLEEEKYPDMFSLSVGFIPIQFILREKNIQICALFL